jgi:MFS family permease
MLSLSFSGANLVDPIRSGYETLCRARADLSQIKHILVNFAFPGFGTAGKEEGMTETAPAEASAGGRRPPTFRALRHRNFRLMWGGLIVSAIGTWMQIVAQSLLVLQITGGSALALGTVALAQAASFFLFALLGGGIADRLDKRRLLLVTQSLQLAIALILGILTATGAIEVWMIVLASFLTGTVLSFDQPTRSALIPMLVPPEDLMGAIALQSAVFNGGATVGPALAGITIGIVGLAGNYFINAASFLGVLFALASLRIPPEAEARARRREPLRAAIAAALGTVRRDAVLPAVLVAYGALLFCGPSPSLILPVYAVAVLQLDPGHLGLLFSATGLGTILGSLILASLGEVRRKGLLLLLGLALWSLTLIGFALSQLFWLSLVMLALYGAAQSAVGTTSVTLLQTRVPPEMRGRVMSLVTLLIMGVRPLGDFPAGALISLIGAPVTAILGAGLVGAVALGLAARRPALRAI